MALALRMKARAVEKPLHCSKAGGREVCAGGRVGGEEAGRCCQCFFELVTVCDEKPVRPAPFEGTASSLLG